MNNKRFSIVLIAAMALSTSTAASANTAEWVNNPVPLGTDIVDGFTMPAGPLGAVIGNLDGYITNDLILNTTSDWTAAQLIVSLTGGSIWQQPDDTGNIIYNGTTIGKPDPMLFPFLPSSEYDSYVFDPHGGAYFGTACGGPGPCDHETFNTSEVDAIWGSRAEDTADVGVFSIARVTLSPDANGSAQVAFTVEGEAGKTTANFLVQNGQIVPVPEPATLGLLALGGCVVLARR